MTDETAPPRLADAAARDRWARAQAAARRSHRARARAGLRANEDAPSSLDPTAAALLTAGAIGAIGALWLPWYEASRADITADLARDGWAWLQVIDVLAVVTGIVALVTVTLGALNSKLAERFPLALFGLGGTVLFLVCFRIGAPPSPPATQLSLGVSVAIGPFIEAGALLLLLAGAHLAWRSADPVRVGLE